MVGYRQAKAVVLGHQPPIHRHREVVLDRIALKDTPKDLHDFNSDCNSMFNSFISGDFIQTSLFSCVLSELQATATLLRSALIATGTPAIDTGGPGGVNAPKAELGTPCSFCFIATRFAHTRWIAA